MNINLAGFDLVFQINEKEPRPVFLETNYFFGRRGIGGSIRYYKFLFKAVYDWLSEEGLDRNSVALI